MIPKAGPPSDPKRLRAAEPLSSPGCPAHMHHRLQQYAADHKHVLDLVARQAGFRDPVAVHLDQFYDALIRNARRGEILPIEGVLVRDWHPNNRRVHPGMLLGMRLYEIEGIRFVRVRFPYTPQVNVWGFDLTVVDRP